MVVDTPKIEVDPKHIEWPLAVREHELCEMLFYTDDGRPWRLHKMPFFKPIYDNPSNRLLLKTARQSTKTTLLRNKLTIRSIARPGNSALYVAPTGNQLSDFSKKKLDTVFVHNKVLKESFTHRSLDWNVMFKQFRVSDKISTINLRSTGGSTGAEGVRGGTYNDIFKDEYQSLIEEHLPVIDECAATFQGEHAPFQAYFCNTGTPLSHNNPIEREWNISKGYEWLIRCPHCHIENDPIGMQHIDPKKPFLFCQHCGKDMNERPLGYRMPPQGRWVATNPGGVFPGYRVVRLMMPWATWKSDNSTGILDRLATYRERQFANEIMGMPFDSGQIPITESNIKAISTSEDDLPLTVEDELRIAAKYAPYQKFAGLDWAMNSEEATASYTKYGIYAFYNGKLRLIYAHQFVGKGSSDPDSVIAHITERMNRFNVTILAADYGVGYFENKRLQALFPANVITMHYTGSSMRVRTQFDVAGQKYMVPRTPSLDEMVTAVKKGTIELPRWESSNPYVSDWLRLTLEISDKTRTVLYRRSGTDDFAHVTNYAHLAWRMYNNGELTASAIPTSQDLGPIGVSGSW